VHRDTHVLTEMQALLSHYFFTFAPQYGDEDQDVRAAQGVSLLNEYIDELGVRMKGGPKSIKKILDKTITVPEEEFFTSEELENFAAFGTGRFDTNSRLEPDEAERVVRLVASHIHQDVTAFSPIVSAELPGNGERFEGVIPPVVTAPCFSIRKGAVSIFSLGDYVPKCRAQVTAF